MKSGRQLRDHWKTLAMILTSILSPALTELVTLVSWARQGHSWLGVPKRTVPSAWHSLSSDLSMARPFSSLRHQLYCHLFKGISWLSVWSCPYFPSHFPILCISNRESPCLLWKYLFCVISTFFPISPSGMEAPGEQGLCLVHSCAYSD